MKIHYYVEDYGKIIGAFWFEDFLWLLYMESGNYRTSGGGERQRVFPFFLSLMKILALVNIR